VIDLSSTIKIAYRALKVNKMRSILTSLGIIIGVGAVIIMLAIGSGASKQISDQISSMGSNLIIVLPGATTSNGARMGMGSKSTLTVKDSQAIESECPSVLSVAPIVQGTGQIVYGNQNWSTQIIGSVPNILEIRDWPLSSGRRFFDEDVKNATKVCILGQTVVTNLFGDLDPLGKTIRIKGIPFKIIGILDRKGQSIVGQDQDDGIFIPLTTAQKKLFGEEIPGMVRVIMIKTKDAQSLDTAQDEITSLLRAKHHLGARQEDDFSIRNLTQMMQMAQQSANVMGFLLGAIASISLLVGGIGIMNIMLVSVTERTKEIGIRMAIGAKTWDIRLQFLIEALMLSLSGGIVGIIIGIAGASIVSSVAGWPTMVSPLSVILSFGFSGLVGIFFGFYPAYKASLLSPIDALRYE